MRACQEYRSCLVEEVSVEGWEGCWTHAIHRLPETIVQPVIQLRQKQGWCHEAIAAYLNQREHVNGSSGSVYTILK